MAAEYPGDTKTFTPPNDDGTTQVNTAYMNQRDEEIEAIEASLGAKLVVATTKPLVNYLRVAEDDVPVGVGHVWLANKVDSNARVSIGPIAAFDPPTEAPETPLGWLHVRPKAVPNAPSWTAPASADGIVVENDPNVGMVLLTRAGGSSNIYFASPSSLTQARVSYVGSVNEMRVGTAEAGSSLALMAGDEVHVLTLSDDGSATFAGDVTVQGNTLRLAETTGALPGGQSGDIRWNTNGIHVNVNGTWKVAEFSS